MPDSHEIACGSDYAHEVTFCRLPVNMMDSS